MIFRSTFQKLIKRYMDNVALREEAQMRLLARIKAGIYEPHGPSMITGLF